MIQRRTAFLVALLWFAPVALGVCAEIPPAPSGYVNDYAGLLSPDARARLESKLGAFEKETSNQVVIAVFPSLDGGSLEDFSIRLAERWKIGSAKNDNGVILLIFKNDRQMRIEVGYGLEGALPDATAFQIIQNEIVPRFRSEDFDGGVEWGVDAILAATRGEYRAAPVGEERMEKMKPLIFLAIVFFFLVPLILYAGLFFFCVQAMGPLGAVVAVAAILVIEVLRRAIFSGRTYSRGGPGIWGGGGFGGGSGGFGGGFGGGGGGGFGGGGAGGRW